MSRELWEHQAEAVDAIRQTVRHGVYRIVVASPTGSGKTVMASVLAEAALRKGKKLAFVVSHLSLIDQVLEEFYNEGVSDVGIIQSDNRLTDYSKPIQICSIQTLRSREFYPDCQAAIFDECHVLHDYHKQWLKHPDFQHLPIIGFSASPWTRGLGKFFDTLLVAATTKELMAKGLLCKYRIFGVSHPDLSDVKVVAGDFHEKQLSGAMQAGSLTADIVRTWKERWGKDKTILFAVDLAHAQALQQRFIEAGISCGYQEARTPISERREIKRKFHNGEYRVVANVGTLTTGIDWDIRCLSVCRPTMSEMLWVQICGRAFRNAPGKDYALLLDHADNTGRLGFPDDIHHDHLDMGKPKPKPTVDGIWRKALPKPCPVCTCMLPRVAGKCTNCGHNVQKSVSGLIERDGELFEIIPGTMKAKARPARDFSMEEKARFFAGLKFYGIEKGYQRGWAARQYRRKFHVWPDHRIETVPPQPPTMEVRQYIRSGQIAWALSKRRQENVSA